MNQTTWIVGGGVIIVALAGWLYMVSGDGLPKTAPKSNPEITLDANTAAATATPETTTVTDANTNTTSSTESKPSTASTQKTAVLHTSMGDIGIKFYEADAPKTVENFEKLATSGFYDGVKFHRVIKGFMDQTGDPKSKDDSLVNEWGTGGPGYKFPDEINPSSALYKTGYKHGVVAMANSGKDTNGSQFFIMASDYPLPPLYTIFGVVTSGLDVVDAINSSPTGQNDRPITPISIKSVEIK